MWGGPPLFHARCVMCAISRARCVMRAVSCALFLVRAVSCALFLVRAVSCALFLVCPSCRARVYSHPVFGARAARMLDRWINFGHARRNFPSG